jgi:hypothetical protein
MTTSLPSAIKNRDLSSDAETRQMDWHDIALPTQVQPCVCGVDHVAAMHASGSYHKQQFDRS